MAQLIRVGFVGTSWYMDGHHLPVFKADPRAALSAICGRNHQRVQELATRYGIQSVYTDYREMINNGSLDAIVIAVPDDLHHPITMAALDAGLHVLCEKPLALNVADAKSMADRAEAAGVQHMTYFTWRWMPHYRYMRELIDEGVIGRIFHSKFSFMFGFARNSQYSWRYDLNRGNGIVGDSGVHMADLVRYLIGDFSRVSANLATSVHRKGPDNEAVDGANDSGSILFETENHTQGLVEISGVARTEDPVLEQQVALHGEAGSLVATLKLGSTLTLHIAKGDESLHLLDIPERFMVGVDTSQPFGTQVVPMFTQQPVGGRLFIDSIIAKQPIVPSLRDGWKAQQVVNATLASHESRCWVEIS